MKVKSCNFKFFSYRANLYLWKEHLHLWIGPVLITFYLFTYLSCLFRFAVCNDEMELRTGSISFSSIRTLSSCQNWVQNNVRFGNKRPVMIIHATFLKKITRYILQKYEDFQLHVSEDSHLICFSVKTLGNKHETFHQYVSENALLSCVTAKNFLTNLTNMKLFPMMFQQMLL